HKVDLVVVAGDVYDRALPQVDAVRLADEVFARLASSRAKVVVTSGNHDSAQRLGFGSRLIDAAGVFIRTDAGSVGTPVLLDDTHGTVAVYGIPFLEPDTVREPWGLSMRSHEAALTAAITRVRDDLAGRRGARSVVLAHAFVAGGEASDSERDISVGGVSMVPTSVFGGIDYVALGHLHGRHALTERIRYCGSPLAYSFSETDHLKGSWLVDLDGAGTVTAEFVEAPVPRPLARLRGSLESLLVDDRFNRHEASYLQITLTDDDRPTQAMERLRARFPHTLVLAFQPAGGERDAAPGARTAGRSDHEIALDFVADLRGTPASDVESRLMSEAVNACCDDSERDVLVGSGGS
ncbi:MAG: exonuclease SbcCD subunit D, partial [Nocardioides sp.]